MFSFLKSKPPADTSATKSSQKWTWSSDPTYGEMRSMFTAGAVPLTFAEAAWLGSLAWAADTAGDAGRSTKDLASKVLPLLPQSFGKPTKGDLRLLADCASDVVKLTSYEAMVAFGDTFRKLPFFGSAWFRVQEKQPLPKLPVDLWLGIGPQIIRLLEKDCKPRKQLALDDLKRFACSPTTITLDFEEKGRFAFATSESDRMETLLAAYLESLYKAKRAAARAAAASRADRDGSTGNPLASNSSSSEDLASAISSLLDLVQSTSDNVADLRSLRDAFRLLSTSLTDSGLASIASKLGSLVSDVLNQPRSAEARESVALAALESLSLLLHAPNGMALDSGYLQSAAQRLVAGVASLLPMAAASGNPATLARLDLFAGNLESLGLSEAAKQVGEAVIRLQMQAMQVIDLGGLSLWLSAGIDEDPIRMEARSLAICFADAFPI